ncbi:anthrone oxygenase family protein [Micromonospora viridifaciens]|uniref:anthrone oxygenase family protein n=1 Tax=Micromonospora viridifaciens TaxID=1881 RepID=UPI001E5C2C35|nr:anthrone oxygenase family protein [Micromonospora viridifaciens]
MRWNVPLNEQLDRAGPGDDPAAVRGRFEASWVRWNLARTVTSVAAFGCLIGGLLARA